MPDLDYTAVYGALHERNPKAFAGHSIKDYVGDIAALVAETGAQTLLDYGAGKGYQYLADRVHDAWGGILPVCYDVGVRQLRRRPEGRFDGVISTDVLEHIGERDLDGVLADIFGYADRFVFLAIACRPAKKALPDGRNAHLTIRPPEWWEHRIERFRRDGLIVRTAYDTGTG